MHTDHFFTPPVTVDQTGVCVCLIFRYSIGHGIGLWIREKSLLIHSPILFALPQTGKPVGASSGFLQPTGVTRSDRRREKHLGLIGKGQPLVITAAPF